MEKTYKVISSFGLKQVFIEHFDTYEAALAAHKKNCKEECVYSYLLETEVTYSSGSSVNNVLRVYVEDE